MMMADDTRTFKKLRHEAAREFAQTMIVIDDEASQESEAPSSQSVGTLDPPSRRARSAATGDTRATHPGTERSGSHALNAKSLIDKAMDLGLICSVLRPKENENFRERVVRAAQAADIVCLDWDIYNDDGEAASKIIGDIIQKDAEQNGRLRLIAIYTGGTRNTDIPDKILDAIPEELREEHEFKKESLQVESKNGVRIVCLFKAHGTQLPAPMDVNQVGEDQLPERLQTEFAQLSEGLLSNVALATVASIRNSTHHVLSKFTGHMDGPFFHHRALIENPDDAEEYAIDIVLSELKGAVNKRQVATTYAGRRAIDARIHEIAGDDATLVLHYTRGEEPKSFPLKADDAIRIITDGLTPALEEKKLSGAPKDGKFRENLSTLFSDSQESARSQMHQFAALTGVRAHPGGHPYQSGQLFPRLGLGTIVQDKDGVYLMCLQASCDSVRIEDTESFLFVPLENKEEDKESSKPDHVVPISLGANRFRYVGLSISKKSYRVVRSIEFAPCQATETVKAEKSQDRPGFDFMDAKGNAYRWIADLKRQRALRTVQRLGQHMGRLGFDEFEPYRK